VSLFITRIGAEVKRAPSGHVTYLAQSAGFRSLTGLDLDRIQGKLVVSLVNGDVIVEAAVVTGRTCFEDLTG
jgi:hypothetical protein